MRALKNIPTYILCGGLSTRMKEEKGLVHYKGKPFIQHIISAVQMLSDTIFLVTNNEVYKTFGYPLINDVYKQKGPVGGIYTALQHSNAKHIMLLSCDIPNINVSILQTYVLNKFEGNSILILKSGNKVCPLIGMYSTHLAPIFKAAILANKLKLLDIIHTIEHKVIQVDEAHEIYMSNINTKQELKTLTQLTTC